MQQIRIDIPRHVWFAITWLIFSLGLWVFIYACMLPRAKSITTSHQGNSLVTQFANRQLVINADLQKITTELMNVNESSNKEAVVKFQNQSLLQNKQQELQEINKDLKNLEIQLKMPNNNAIDNK